MFIYLQYNLIHVEWMSHVSSTFRFAITHLTGCIAIIVCEFSVVIIVSQGNIAQNKRSLFVSHFQAYIICGHTFLEHISNASSWNTHLVADLCFVETTVKEIGSGCEQLWSVSIHATSPSISTSFLNLRHIGCRLRHCYWGGLTSEVQQSPNPCLK
jgi:hypothetical protein